MSPPWAVFTSPLCIVTCQQRVAVNLGPHYAGSLIPQMKVKTSNVWLNLHVFREIQGNLYDKHTTTLYYNPKQSNGIRLPFRHIISTITHADLRLNHVHAIHINPSRGQTCNTWNRELCTAALQQQAGNSNHCDAWIYQPLQRCFPPSLATSLNIFLLIHKK